MATFWVDSLNGNNGDTGGFDDPWHTIPFSITQMSAGDSLHILYADGTPYVHAAALVISTGLLFRGVDENGIVYAGDGVFGDPVGGFDVATRPILQWTGATTGFSHTTLLAMILFGLRIEATGGGTRGYSSDFAGARPLFAGCTFDGWDFGLWLELGGIVAPDVQACTFVDCIVGVWHQNSAQLELYACEFIRCTDWAVERQADTHPVALHNCTFYNCMSNNVAQDHPVTGMANASVTGRNLLAVDNYCRHGLVGDTFEASNAFSSDGNTVFHTVENFENGPGLTDTELDPLFEDAPLDDLHISEPSLVRGGETTAAAILLDGPVMPDPPPVGALGQITKLLRALVRGQNRILVEADGPFQRRQLLPDSWTLMGPTDKPRVAGIEQESDTKIVLVTDMTLREEVDYQLDGTDFAFEVPFPSQTLTGKRLTVYERPKENLLDLDLSVFRDFKYTADTDIPLSGGFATIRKVVLDTLLTPLGSIVWAPNHGTTSNHKQLLPLDLKDDARRRERQLQAIPGVQAVGVELTRSENYHLIAQIRVRTDFGPINERVDLTARAIIL
jgi:hypothetical protein